MLTISCQQKKDYISKDNIDDVLQWLKHCADITIRRQVYEITGKYKQLHWHGLVKVPYNFRYSPYSQYGDPLINGNSFRVQWSKIHNFKGALEYFNKDLLHKS